jgi:hypothetical protein
MILQRGCLDKINAAGGSRALAGNCEICLAGVGPRRVIPSSAYAVRLVLDARSRDRLKFSLTNSLRDARAFDMASLRHPGIAAQNHVFCFGEDAMFEKTLGARVGARASRFRGDLHVSARRDIGETLLALAGLGAAAVFFFGWLMLSDSRQAELPGVDGSDCASLGKGGLACDPHFPGADFQRETADRRDDCESLFKAGRVCFERGAPPAQP